MKRLILLFLFIFLFSINGNVNGAGLSVDVDTIDNLIMIGEEAIFDVSIKNEQEISDKLTFLITDLNWDWEKKFFVIPSKGTENFQLKVKAPEGVVNPDRYSLNLKVYSTLNKNTYVYEPLLITVLDESSLLNLEKLDYSINGLNPEKKDNVLRLIVKNQYDKPLKDVDIFLSSDIFDSVEGEVNFDEAELINEEFLINLNSKASEGWHDVNILLKKGNLVLLNEIKSVKVGKYSNVQEDKEVSSGFLIKKTSVIKKNDGSVLSEQIYRLRLSYFERLFSNVNPKPSFFEESGDDYYYVWEFSVKPGEEYKINIEINYRNPLFLLIALIIMLYLVFHFVESGISIKKKVLTIKSKDGINYMKILLIIKNKGKREIKNVRIVDQLFNVKNVPSDYGTLRPSKVKRKGEDVVLVWDGISLIGNEERILSYRVNVGVKSSIVLPKALVRYKIGKKLNIVKSNSCLVVS